MGQFPSPMPWIKLYTEILDDARFYELTEAMRWRFTELLLLAGECDAEGMLVDSDGPMSIGRIAWRLRQDAERVGATLDLLAEHGYMAQTEGAWFVVSFAKRQGRRQQERREQWHNAQERRREKEGDAPEPVEDISECHAGVIDDTAMTQPPREEKSREEKTIDSPMAVVANPYSPVQRLILELFGAKRYKNRTQAQAVLNLEERYGLEAIKPAAEWAAKQGMALGQAIVSLEKAVPKWGAKGSPTVKGL